MRDVGRHLLALLFLAAASTGTAAQPWNVVDAGAVGDGKTDCTAFFQQILDQAGKAGGGIVDVPAGRFRINGNLSIPENVTLQGICSSPTANSSGDGAARTRSVWRSVRRSQAR